ncbi:FAD dependent oxidoreductase-like protein [Trichoderma reesei QM6a]|uniref:FAD dependent oxidoreductase-like protein n=2 Tax=Hypocrea jecorina TaxID=51453 RepID=G0RTG4_HYPJQ|nr:FAD dependent oxidoreductase-like protein [Trichoderma reesei QM6a]EGR45632.1 FAD dependent oxidoreductase-like protein [Trichoderma reesei QM6a]ETR98729.1 FAD dependent oxidoreductase [Trichoderma reesei RUT C-30]
MSDIIVIGAGVIGLSAALRLQQAGHAVTIIARDFPTPFEAADKRALINYTSQWGGAHNRWVLPTNPNEQREHGFSLVTYRHMEATAAGFPEAGITFMKGIEYFENPPPVHRDLTVDKALQLGLEGFKLLGKDDFPDDRVAWGCEYKTWCVNPMVYCSFLLRRFHMLGGKALSMELRSLDEAFLIRAVPGVKIVVNCSGAGFNDPAVFPTRGQTCLVANPCDATVTRQNADGSWTFCVPRNFHGGTVIGGTKEPDNWDPEPSPETRARLLSAFAATYPPIVADGPLKPLGDIVGRRPTRRGGIRLEREDIPAGEIKGLDDGEGRVLVHAYGLGGRGFELSWGVAEEVLELVKQRVSNSRL